MFVKYDGLCLYQSLIFSTRIERCTFFFPLVDLKDNLKIHVVYFRETHKTDISNSLYGVSESHLKPEL